MNSVGRSLALALALALALHAASASADAKTDADRFFEEGKQLFARGNLAAACSRFEASLASQSGVGARLWLADCYESLGRTASAQREFRLAAQEAQASGDKREQVAQRRADNLEPRVVKIQVTIEQASPDERVEVDGVGVGSAGAAVSVDPGRHLVTATAPGRVSWELTFDATSADRPRTVVVPELARAVAAPPLSASSVSLPPPPPPADPEPLRPMKLGGAVTAGVGVASLAVSGVLAILAIRDNSRSKDGCAATCTPEAHDERTSAIHEANGATYTLVAGAAVLAVGALLFFLAPR